MAWGKRKPSTPLEHLRVLKERRDEAREEHRQEELRRQSERAGKAQAHVDSIVRGMPSLRLKRFVRERATEASEGERRWTKAALLAERGALEATVSIRLLLAFDRRMTQLGQRTRVDETTGKRVPDGNFHDRNLVLLIARMAGMA